MDSLYRFWTSEEDSGNVSGFLNTTSFIGERLICLGADCYLGLSVKSVSRTKQSNIMAAAAANGDETSFVILHQLRRGRFTPAISPFALKLETFLRMASIPYKVFICENFYKMHVAY